MRHSSRRINYCSTWHTTVCGCRSAVGRAPGRPVAAVSRGDLRARPGGVVRHQLGTDGNHGADRGVEARGLLPSRGCQRPCRQASGARCGRDGSVLAARPRAFAFACLHPSRAGSSGVLVSMHCDSGDPQGGRSGPEGRAVIDIFSPAACGDPGRWATELLHRLPGAARNGRAGAPQRRPRWRQGVMARYMPTLRRRTCRPSARRPTSA